MYVGKRGWGIFRRVGAQRQRARRNFRIERPDDFSRQDGLELSGIGALTSQIAECIAASAHHFGPFAFHRNISFKLFKRSLIVDCANLLTPLNGLRGMPVPSPLRLLDLGSRRAHGAGYIVPGGAAGPSHIGWCPEMGLGSFGTPGSRSKEAIGGDASAPSGKASRVGRSTSW